MSEIKLKLKTTSVPNFITVEAVGTFQRQDGWQETLTISIGDLTNEQLDEIVTDWRNELFRKAKLKRDLKRQQNDHR